MAVSALVIGGCAILFLYMTLFRWVDYATCIPTMAKRVDSPPSLEGIESYILTTAVPGMKREKVLKVLENLGPVDIRFQDTTYPPDNVRDTILVNSCMHPLNDLEIYAVYDSEDRLVSISLLNTKD
jgi:hypothetical protein